VAGKVTPSDVQPYGSTVGQTIVSTGPTTPPAWGSGGGGGSGPSITIRGSDADYSILSTDYYVVPGVAQSNRTWTLPLAASVAGGYAILIADPYFVINAPFHDLTITCDMADFIDQIGGGTITLTTPGQWRFFVSDGVSVWKSSTLLTADIPAVTSVALSLPAELSVSGSPITSSGTLSASWANETANYVFAGPTTGSPNTPGFRALVAADIPNIAESQVTNLTTDLGLKALKSLSVTATEGVQRSSGSDLSAAAQFKLDISGLTQDSTPDSANDYVATWDASASAHKKVKLSDLPGGGGGGGTVTSVALSLPAELTVSGSPVTTSGTLSATWANEATNKVFASPNGSTGTPTFRALVAADIPSLSYVTSVGLSLPAELTVSGSPVTSSGTLSATWASETQHYVFAAPSGSSGTPGFRALVTGDLPTVAVAQGGTAKTSYTAGSIPFATSAPALDESNADLFWDNSAKFLGVGINSSLPTKLSVKDYGNGVQLTLKGDSAGVSNGAKMQFSTNGGKNFSVGSGYNGGTGDPNSFAIRDDSAGVIRLFIDTNGYVGIGPAATAAGTVPTLLYVGASTAIGQAMFEQGSADADEFDLIFKKARGTVASPAAVTSGDPLGSIWWEGYSGAGGYAATAAIKCFSEGTVATTRVASRLSFWTGTDAAPTVVTERMRIDSNGDLLLGCTATAAGTARTAGATYLSVRGASASGNLELSSDRTDSDAVGMGGVICNDAANVTDSSDKRIAQIAMLRSGSTAGRRGGMIEFLTRADNAATATERVRINNIGQVLIGQTTPLQDTGDTMLTVHGLGTFGGIEISGTLTDGDATQQAVISATDPHTVAANKRIANINFLTDGSTANNRGGRISFSTKSDGASGLTTRLIIDSRGNVVVGTGALSTSATDGFLYIPSSAGAPTGVPTSYTGAVPIEVDTTNNKLMGYYGGNWVNLSPAAGGGGGATTSTGAAGSEPGSPTTGDLYFSNDVPIVERYSGSAWPTWGPIFAMTTPPVNAPSTSTTISHGGGYTSGATSINVASSTGFPSTPFLVLIGSEDLKVTNVSGTTWTVTRGYNGTSAASISDGATITLVNWIWVNQGATATVTQQGNSIFFDGGTSSGTQNLRMRGRLIGNTSTGDLQVGMLMMVGSQNGGGGGIYMRESSSGKVYGLRIFVATNGAAEYLATTYGSATSFGGNSSLVGANAAPMLWFRFTISGSNILAKWSADGKNWQQLQSMPKTTAFTTAPDEWGVYLDPQNVTYSNAMTLLSFKEA
jgi:hypothetical protein